MKRHLIYHTHVITNRHQNDAIQVQTRAISDDNDSVAITCSLDRISRDGMTLSCDEYTLKTLLPKRTCVAPKNPVTLETNFCLNEDIQAKCRVIYTRRLSKNQFNLELKFFELAERDMSLIDQFVEQSLHGGKTATPRKVSEAIDDTAEDTYKPSLHHLKAKSKQVFSKVA